MKNVTRILCLLLAGIMILGLVATAAFAAEQIPVINTETTAAGIPNDAGNITWLSDLYNKDIEDAGSHKLLDDPQYVMYSYVQPKGGTTTPRLFTVNKNFFSRVGAYSNNGSFYEWKSGNVNIILGANGTVCKKGLGLQPTAAKSDVNSEVIFDISSFDVDHFYSLVGLTGKANNSTYHETEMSTLEVSQQKLTFILYGSKESEYAEDMEFTELARCENICEYGVGEFNVNIEGYKFLRLVCDNVNENNGSSYNNEAAWGNLCIYKAGAGNGLEGAFGNVTPTDNYRITTSGVYLGIPRSLRGGITYLSKIPFQSSSNTPSEDYPEGKPSCINFPYNQPDGNIIIGEANTMFYKGIGMHPKDPSAPINESIESWTTIDISHLNVDRFYSAVGITNEAGKQGGSEGVIFRVYGDSTGNGEFTMIGQSELITDTKTGEFNIDITGVKVLKLVVVAAGQSHAASACAFADAAVYSSTYSDKTETSTEPTTNTEEAETNTQPSLPIGLIAGAGAALLVVVAVVVLIIVKKKKAA